MKIEHVALWTRDLERLKSFYETYFSAIAGAKYTNPRRGFKSYFLSFASGARLELMYLPNLGSASLSGDNIGLAHFAVSAGSKENVDALTERLRADGHAILSEPRTTGDGYYESVIADPDGNRIELTSGLRSA